MIAFRQIAWATPQTPQATVAVTYAAAQTVGNLNLVAVGWSTPAAVVTGVSDSSGNVYTVAAGPTVQAGVQAQVIYIAPNIRAAAANERGHGDVQRRGRVSGCADCGIQRARLVNPLDQAAGATGLGTTSNSGPVTTANANDLLVGANYVNSVTTAAGTGTRRGGLRATATFWKIAWSPRPGACSATAAIISGNWVMQVVALRAAGGGGGHGSADGAGERGGDGAVEQPDQPDVDGLDGQRGGDGVSGGAVPGAGVPSFVQVGTPTAASYSDPGLTAATSYSYRVRAADAAGNLSGYSTVATTTTLTSTDTRRRRCRGAWGRRRRRAAKST